jgi:hypothetical protein
MQPRAALALAALFAVACASAGVEDVQRHASEESVLRPPVFVVYDFAVSPDDVVSDTFGEEFRAPEPDDKRYLEAREVATTLSGLIVEKLGERGIEATRGSYGGLLPMHALVLKGQFVTIDAGSRLKRMTIGFGAGSSELRVRGQVYQVTERGLRRISEAEVEATGSKMPGMAIPVAGGAVAGTVVTSAVVSGGMSVVREAKGQMHGDASRLADEIAERAEAFYKRRGWL